MVNLENTNLNYINTFLKNPQGLLSFDYYWLLLMAAQSSLLSRSLHLQSEISWEHKVASHQNSQF